MKNSPHAMKLFNTPIEVGLRALIILKEFYPQKVEFQKLVYLDYLLVNSGDVGGGPSSMHAKVPFRSSAISIRRKDLTDGLELLICRELAAKHFDPRDGVLYSASELTNNFSKYFESKYFFDLVERARWLKKKFGKMDTNEVADFLNKNLGSWMSEFSREATNRRDWHLSDGN